MPPTRTEAEVEFDSESAAVAPDNGDGAVPGEERTAPSVAPKPRRVKLPSRGNVTLNLVQGASDEPRPEPRQRRQEPFAERAAAASATWEAEAARFADTVEWTLERVGPHYDKKNRRVPLGTFPDTFIGPITHQVLGGIGGGGHYYATTTPQDGVSSRRIGPFKVIGEPRLDVGIQIEEEPETEGPPTDFTAGAAANGDSDDEVEVHHPQLGIIKMRRSAVERQQSAYANEAIQGRLDTIVRDNVEAQRRADDKFTALLAEIAKARDMAPREDPTVRFLTMERERLQAEKEARAEDAKELRLRADADRKEAADQRKHEREMAEAKAETERDRLQAEKESQEKKFEAERLRLAAEKDRAEERALEMAKINEVRLEKSHAAALAMVKTQKDPMDSLVTMLTTFQKFGDILTPPPMPSADDAGPVAPKSGIDKAIELAKLIGAKAWPSIEPGARAFFQSMVPGAAQQQQQQLQPAALPAPAPTALPRAKLAQRPAAPAAQPATTQPAAPVQVEVSKEEAAKGLNDVLIELSSAMERNLAPNLAWAAVEQAAPLFAPQVAFYDSADMLLAHLDMMVVDPDYSSSHKPIKKIIELARGNQKKWADDFLACARRSVARTTQAQAKAENTEAGR